MTVAIVLAVVVLIAMLVWVGMLVRRLRAQLARSRETVGGMADRLRTAARELDEEQEILAVEQAALGDTVQRLRGRADVDATGR